jgi:hypothetical protein
MSHRFRRYSKRELLDNLHVDYILSVFDLGLTPGTNRWEVLHAFLDRGEARAERLVEDRDGFVILQSIPGRRNTVRSMCTASLCRRSSGSTLETGKTI